MNDREKTTTTRHTLQQNVFSSSCCCWCMLFFLLVTISKGNWYVVVGDEQIHHHYDDGGGGGDGDEINSVLKCCAKGESLNMNSVCQSSSPQDENWQPYVYSPSQKQFLQPSKNILFVENTRPTCTAPVVALEEAVFQPVLIKETGALFVSHSSQTSVPVAAGKFCIAPKRFLICVEENDDMFLFLAQVTAANSSSEKTTTNQQINDAGNKKIEKNIKKCCGTDLLYSEVTAKCVTRNLTTTPTNFLSEDTVVYYGFPSCDGRPSFEYAIGGKLDEKFSLNMDGTLRASNGDSIDNYCVEHIVEQPDEKATVFTCAPPPPPLPNSANGGYANADDNDDFRYSVYPFALLISSLFLIATLISSFMLPTSYHALHWKCQTHYIVCLLIGYLLLAVTQISSEQLKNSAACLLIATAMHFFFLSAFFWLNTMCFNIWWTFRDLRPTSLDKSQELFRLFLYELYAWGVPLVIVIFGYIMDKVLASEYASILKPRFGHRKCWFYGDKEIFVYFYGPMGILLSINFILFLATTRELTCGLWKREVVKSSTEKVALSHICLKLVIVMGITWIADLLSWTIGGPDYVWYFTDLVNALQGVFIFIVIGCQPQVINAFKRVWCLSNSSSSGNNVSSNAIIINEQSLTKPVETLC